jgi:hypothetical protein
MGVVQAASGQPYDAGLSAFVVRPAMTFALTVLAAASLATTAVAEDKRAVAPGGDPALACGQLPDGRAYWTEYAFCDTPVRGPGASAGLILWNHGMDGHNDQYKTAPPFVVRRLARSGGWDVVKLNRNPLHERGWTASGNKHVDELVQRARQARTQGYARVIAAGQSYGGAIALEANARAADVFYGVFAVSPGHGSDASSPGGSTRGIYFILDKYLLDPLAGQNNARVVVSVPPGDALHPNRDSDPIGPKIRKLLLARGLPFVQFDETLPITGHGAAYTGQFDAWFGPCLQAFLDPRRAVPPGETRCAPPDPVPAFLLPAGLTIPAPGQDGTARWLGAWDGRWPGFAAEVRFVIDKAEGKTASLYYCVGPGPQRNLSMACGRYTNGRLEGNRIVVDSGRGPMLELILGADGRSIDVTHKSGATSLAATLKPPASNAR